MQTFIHYFLHIVFPVFIAYGFFRKDWKKVYLILLATMLVDLDHLLASPVFDPNRCSINYHPLHTYYAMIVYVALLFLRKPFNIIGLGLLLHMFADGIDCLIMHYSQNTDHSIIAFTFGAETVEVLLYVNELFVSKFILHFLCHLPFAPLP